MKALTTPFPTAKGIIAKEIKDKLIHEYAPLIKYIAHRIALRVPPQIEVSDLINAGVIGFMDAIEKFDPSREIQFKTYAEFRIRGAILDELRSLDWVPRSIRQKANQIEAACQRVEQELGRPADDEEMASAMNLKIEDFYEILAKVKGINIFNQGDMGADFQPSGVCSWAKGLVDGEDKTPYSQLKLKEIGTIIGRAIEELPEKERLVITLYYYEEMNMKEIGKVLGITESRVSQLHTKAILRLRGKLKSAF